MGGILWDDREEGRSALVYRNGPVEQEQADTLEKALRILPFGG